MTGCESLEKKSTDGFLDSWSFIDAAGTNERVGTHRIPRTQPRRETNNSSNPSVTTGRGGTFEPTLPSLVHIVAWCPLRSHLECRPQKSHTNERATTTIFGPRRIASSPRGRTLTYTGTGTSRPFVRMCGIMPTEPSTRSVPSCSSGCHHLRSRVVCVNREERWWAAAILLSPSQTAPHLEMETSSCRSPSPATQNDVGLRMLRPLPRDLPGYAQPPGLRRGGAVDSTGGGGVSRARAPPIQIQACFMFPKLHHSCSFGLTSVIPRHL